MSPVVAIYTLNDDYEALDDYRGGQRRNRFGLPSTLNIAVHFHAPPVAFHKSRYASSVGLA